MYRLQQVRHQVQQASQAIAARVGQRDLLLQQKAAARTAWDAADQKLGEYDLVQILLQQTSEYARQQAKARIEEIVTHALTVVFDRDYKFQVVLDVKGNQPVAEYFLESDGVITQLKPPDYDRGGGVADVVSLALRLAVGELIGLKGPLFLDEVGKHVSQEYQPNVAYFLKQYSEQFGRQIILITHNEHLAEIGDTSIAVTLVNGTSKVTTI
jgi:DNA repair exonuclease SbcCD ATPase subunit